MLKELYKNDDSVVHVSLICNGKEEATNARVNFEDFQNANQKILEKVENGEFKNFQIRYYGKNQYTITVETKESYDIGF